MTLMPRRGTLAALAVLVAGVAPGRSQEASDPGRLIEALRLTPGAVLAEIGAGDGTLTLALARHVGPAGRVYTTELGAGRLAALRRAVARSSLTQIEVVEADDRQTNLPGACCDAIVMRDVYHHFADPAAMNASLLAALKPEGRLAIIDFQPRGDEADSPPDRSQGGAHGVGRDTVAEELAAAGFTAIAVTGLDGRRFMVVAQKPPA